MSRYGQHAPPRTEGKYLIPVVVPTVVWAKLEAMARGAEIATQRLWV